MPERQRKWTRPHFLFLWLAPFLYAAFALLTPAFQTPDEHQHLFRAWQLSQLELVGVRRGTAVGGVLPDNLGKAVVPEIGTLDPHAERPVPQRDLRALWNDGTAVKNADPPRFYNFPGSSIYSPVGYIPQVAAVWLGAGAGLSVEGVVRSGRMLNALATILLIAMAIRLTPIGALPMMWVGLLPTTIAASASFGQDGIVIGGACLLTAVGLRAIVNRALAGSDFLIAASLAIAVTLAKLVYLPLALIGGQPFAGRRIEWRRMIAPILICVAAAALSALWLSQVKDLIVGMHDVPPAATRLQAWLNQPAELGVLLARTYVVHGDILFSTLFRFGWLNIGPVVPAAALSCIACGFALLAGNGSQVRITVATRLWLATIGVSIIVAMSIAMHLYWTPAGVNSVQGLQGRYFVPVMPALLIALLPNRSDPPDYSPAIAALLGGANIFALAAIGSAFYR